MSNIPVRGTGNFAPNFSNGVQGRFTSPDAPFADQDPNNPQSWNLYQYGYNNPLTNVDEDGRSVWTKVAKFAIKAIKTGDAMAAAYDTLQDARTVLDSKASMKDRVIAGISLASEVLPVSIGDAKDAIKLAQKGVDAGKQALSKGPDDVKDGANSRTISRNRGPANLS